MDSHIKEALIQQLDTLPVHITAGVQHVVRCPYCGDSDNFAHGHFSIRIDPSDPLDPILYNCWKCPASGLFTVQTMNDLGLTVDNELRGGLSKYIQASCRVHRITMMKTETYEIPKVRLSGFALDKLNYLRDRLGITFDATMCQELGIILDLEDFMAQNKIDQIYMPKALSKGHVRFLNYNYVGFLSKNKNLIAMRFIYDKPEFQKMRRDAGVNEPRRWEKCKINPKNMDTNTYYAPPASIDILYTDPVNIHIAEGPLDILSIKANFRHEGINLYYAICGFGYSSALSSIIKLGINTGLNLHIYGDRDKTDLEIMKQIERSTLEPWFDNIFIHRNGSGQKDYGVPPNLINDTVRRIR